MAKTSVLYHNYYIGNEPFFSGSNYYYVENAKLLHEKSPSDIKLVSHDFRNVVLGGEKLPKLTGDDVLLSNVGPYAHVYHYLREKCNLKFRIVHDVQAALWSGYLFQEKMCGRFMREGDKVMFLSEFARQLYIQLFPESLNRENTFVCAPFMYFFPKNIKREEKSDDCLTLGWVGRVTPEKNFNQALEAFIRLYKEYGNVKFIVAGSSFNWFKHRIIKKLRENKVRGDSFFYVNKGHFVPYDGIWDVYRGMDVFLFPSLSINETLGRAMVEACYAGVPVVAARHSAAPEVLDQRNLVPVKYRDDLFQLDNANPYSFGKVDLDRFVEKLYNYRKLSRTGNIRRYADHHEKLFNILRNTEPKERLKRLDSRIKKFIDNLHLYQDHANLSMEQMMKRTKQFITGKTGINENYHILRNYTFFLSAFLNYNPYASLNGENKIRPQIFLARLKIPFKRPIKYAYYFYKKHRLKSRYSANFNFD